MPPPASVPNSTAGVSRQRALNKPYPLPVSHLFPPCAQADPNAKRIVGLVKEGGRITGYQLSDETFVSKPQAVSMAKQGQIAGVGVAHRGDTEYPKSIPNGSKNDNLGNLPSVSPESQA